MCAEQEVSWSRGMLFLCLKRAVQMGHEIRRDRDRRFTLGSRGFRVPRMMFYMIDSAGGWLGGMGRDSWILGRACFIYTHKRTHAYIYMKKETTEEKEEKDGTATNESFVPWFVACSLTGRAHRCCGLAWRLSWRMVMFFFLMVFVVVSLGGEQGWE